MQDDGPQSVVSPGFSQSCSQGLKGSAGRESTVPEDDQNVEVVISTIAAEFLFKSRLSPGSQPVACVEDVSGRWGRKVNGLA